MCGEKFLSVDLSSSAKPKAERDCQKSIPSPRAGTIHLCWLWYKLILTIHRSLWRWRLRNIPKQFVSVFHHPYCLRVFSNSSLLRHGDTVPSLSLAALAYLKALTMFLLAAFSQDEISHMVEDDLVWSRVERVASNFLPRKATCPYCLWKSGFGSD